MRIVVAVKQILDPRGISVRRDKERMFINREEYIVDPSSKSAIEAALRLKEASDATVIALSAGEPRAEEALREALAMGCDEAYLLCDNALRGADISVTVNVLAAAIRKLGGVDLVVAGRAAGDTSAGQTGPRLAEALSYAQITDAYALALEGSRVQAARRWGRGYAAVEAPFPAVITVAPEAFPPRFAPGARIMNAYSLWQVPLWSAAELELDTAALTPLLSFRGETFPAPLEGERLRGNAARVAQDLVTALRQQHLVAQAGG
jgi:electron transfer flavoprotein beta subunit